MSETRTVRLGDIAEINPKGDKLSSDTNVSFVGMADLNAPKAEGREDSLRLFSEVSKGYTQFRRGDILVAKITPCWENGKIGIANISQSHGAGSTEFHVVRPHENIDTRYLLHKLRDPYVSALGAIRMTGSAGQRRVPASFISDLNIELPSLEEQKKYALIKDLQMEIAEKRERQQELFKELKSSLFQLMLDDENETVNLGDVASFIGGSSLPTGEPFKGQEGGVLLMKVSDMNTPGNNNEIHHTSLWVSEYGNDNQIVPAGSVVIPKRGASIATNKKRLITRPTVLDPNLMAIIPKSEKLSSQFLYHWFLQFDLTSITSGSSVPQLNKKDLSPLEIRIPSYQHQINFAKILATIKY